MKVLQQRERLILAGLFLSKFDRDGLNHFGFASFQEAYNAMSYAMGGKPTSIKNYMQEFDPFFPNRRQGWHKRPIRNHCKEALERFGKLSLTQFSSLISSLLLPTPLEEFENSVGLDENHFQNESFSKRLITGIAAEGFFESSFPKLTEFASHTLANVTRFGCGFDFRVTPPNSDVFLAFEVKGISGLSGDIMMTEKEHRVAEHLRDRYYLCVVSNFIEKPLLTISQNPISVGLDFSRKERIQTIVSWHTRIA